MSDIPQDLQFTQEAFLRYSTHSIREQAIPHVVDGLLPTQRRFILALQDLAAASGKPHKKSSLTCSHVTGHYSPQGAAVYDVLVNMSRNWRIQSPLTDPEGNWGEIENGRAGAERYTEIRLSQFAEAAVLADLPDKRTKTSESPHGIVPATPTYLNTHLEEDYLPARLPLLLINGSTGIAVGLAQDFQPLCAEDVIRETLCYLATGECSPDQVRAGFPTQCPVVSSQGEFVTALGTGRGTFRTAAPYETTQNTIILTSIPDGQLINRIGDSFNDWRRREPNCPFTEMRNESSNEGVRLVFQLRRGTKVPATGTQERHNLLRQLYQNTQGLLISHTVNQTALHENFPRVFGFVEIIETWATERSEIIRRRAERGLIRLEAELRRLRITRFTANCIDAVTGIVRSFDEADVTERLKALTHSVLKNPIENDEDAAVVLKFNLRQLLNLNGGVLEERVRKAEEEYRDIELLATDLERRNKEMRKELDALQDLVPASVCEFRSDMAFLLEKPATTGPSPRLFKWERVTRPNPAEAPSVVIQTAKGFLLRTAYNSIKTEPRQIELDQDDKILRATPVTASNTLFITKEGKLIPVTTTSLPLNAHTHTTRVASEGAILVEPVADKATHLSLHTTEGTVKYIPLSKIQTLRTTIKLPTPLVGAYLVNEDTLSEGLLGLERGQHETLPDMTPARMKLPQLPKAGRPVKVTSGLYITIQPNSITKKRRD